MYFVKFGYIYADKSTSNPHYRTIRPATYTSDLNKSIFYYQFKIYGEYNLP